MAAAWFEQTIEQHLPRTRYRDPPLRPQAAPGEIRDEALTQFKGLLEQRLHDLQRDNRWFGCFITEPKEHLQVEPRAQTLSDQAFLNRFRAASVMRRNGFTRLAFTRRDWDGKDTLYANGQAYTLAGESGDFLPAITRYRELHFGYLQEWLAQPACLELLSRLYNQGHFEFADE
jgi:50S ribosomal protein L16 3-hydroxylase